MAIPGSTAGPVRAAGRPQRLRLGDILVAQKAVSPEQLKLALDEQKRSGRRLGRVLVEMAFVAEEEIARALSRQLNLAFVDLKQHHFNPEVVLKLPEVAARRFRAVALEERGAKMLVGMADPTDLFAFDELTRILKKDVEPVVVTESEVTHALDRVYRRTEKVRRRARELQHALGEPADSLGAPVPPVQRVRHLALGHHHRLDVLLQDARQLVEGEQVRRIGHADQHLGAALLERYRAEAARRDLGQLQHHGGVEVMLLEVDEREVELPRQGACDLFLSHDSHLDQNASETAPGALLLVERQLE